MIVVLFRSRLSGEAGQEYAEDGERLSVIEFDSEEHLAAWREHPEHRRAQARGKETFYSEYRLTVAETIRDYGFRRG